jgi:hypothetical protein
MRTVPDLWQGVDGRIKRIERDGVEVALDQEGHALDFSEALERRARRAHQPPNSAFHGVSKRKNAGLNLTGLYFILLASLRSQQCASSLSSHPLLRV